MCTHEIDLLAEELGCKSSGLQYSELPQLHKTQHEFSRKKLILVNGTSVNISTTGHDSHHQLKLQGHRHVL